MSKIGMHVSAAGGVANAPENAHQLGGECFQFFSRSPRGGPAPAITNEQAKEFKARSKKYGFDSYIHTPYYINFASPKKNLSQAAPRIIREELERASQLGVKYVVTHLGSARDWPNGEVNQALKQTITGLQSIYKTSPKFSAQLLLEISAGAGAIIGSTFEELGHILKELKRPDVHICLDSCHMFSSGYDVRTKEAVNDTMKQFKKHIGTSHLKLMHVNDSQHELNSHKDRHEHIGRGTIGEQGFKAMLNHPALKKVNFILETKHAQLEQDLALLKKFRG